jgi:hypothetical protein
MPLLRLWLFLYRTPVSLLLLGTAVTPRRGGAMEFTVEFITDDDGDDADVVVPAAVRLSPPPPPSLPPPFVVDLDAITDGSLLR